MPNTMPNTLLDCDKLLEELLALQAEGKHEEFARKVEEVEQGLNKRERERKEREKERRERERERDEAEDKLRDTTLPEFLRACHTEVFHYFSVRVDAAVWFQGDPTHAKNKLRPDRIVFWDDFIDQQALVWEKLMQSTIVTEQHFLSKLFMKETRKTVAMHPVGSERDLLLFHRLHFKKFLEQIIKKLYDSPRLRRTFQLRGSLTLEYHFETLRPDSQVEEVIANSEIMSRLSHLSHPRDDQACVYNVDTSLNNDLAAFAMEYKAPNKLPLNVIYEGLHDMELEEVIKCDTTQGRLRQLIAAIITQAFSYMIGLGVEFGCVSTGEAFIFLCIPEDPRTVQYFLAVPKGDVGKPLDGTLALKAPPRSKAWQSNAIKELNCWEVAYEDIPETFPMKEKKSSEYRPPRHDGFVRMPPIHFRRPARSTSPSRHASPDQHDSGDESEPDAMSRQPISQKRSYCTQRCLLGLAQGGLLDLSCPNVQAHVRNHRNAKDHKTARHRIDSQSFCAHIRQQLAENLDVDCYPEGVHGACGALFRVTLASYGYTVAAKAIPMRSVHLLQKEEEFYQRLRPIQGTTVPVHLGMIDLEEPYFYKGIPLFYMMFLSYGGRPIFQYLSPETKSSITKQKDAAEQTLLDSGVLHEDFADRNILWNEENSSIMVIDFERAKMIEPRKALGTVSANRNRKKTQELDTDCA